MPNTQEGNTQAQPKIYDLEERTAQFGEDVIRFCRKLPTNAITSRIISQLIGCTTAVGANYSEADDAVSGREFRQKIGYCKKEARESKHFLRMIAVAVPGFENETSRLRREATELHLIFNAIYRKLSR